MAATGPLLNRADFAQAPLGVVRVLMLLCYTTIAIIPKNAGVDVVLD